MSGTKKCKWCGRTELETTFSPSRKYDCNECRNTNRKEKTERSWKDILRLGNQWANQNGHHRVYIANLETEKLPNLEPELCYELMNFLSKYPTLYPILLCKEQSQMIWIS